MFIFLFMTDMFLTNTKDCPCISRPLYKPIKNRLRKNISPGLIVGELIVKKNNFWGLKPFSKTVKQSHINVPTNCLTSSWRSPAWNAPWEV